MNADARLRAVVGVFLGEPTVLVEVQDWHDGGHVEPIKHLSPAAARALAAELISTADAIERRR